MHRQLVIYFINTMEICLLTGSSCIVLFSYFSKMLMPFAGMITRGTSACMPWQKYKAGNKFADEIKFLNSLCFTAKYSAVVSTFMLNIKGFSTIRNSRITITLHQPI
jgi:hypothetical protein